MEGTAVILVAASFAQAREGFEATQEILDPWIRNDPDDWRVLDGQRLLIEHRPTKTKLEVRGSEARTLHGIRKGRLFVLDEPSQWQAEPKRSSVVGHPYQSRQGGGSEVLTDRDSPR